jgi:hypothetical protein
LSDYFRKDISDRVGAKSITTAIPNKITLNDRLCARKTIKASMKNTRNFTLMVRINFFMRMIDLDFYFVEDRFGANEPLSIGRISAPDNSRSTINLGADDRIRLDKPIETG